MSTHKFRFDSKKRRKFNFDIDTDLDSLICAICKEKYEIYHDPFILIYDTDSFIEITYELCLNCIHTFTKCQNCKTTYNDPWFNVFFDIKTNKHCCTHCLMNDYIHTKNKHLITEKFNNCNRQKFCKDCKNHDDQIPRKEYEAYKTSYRVCTDCPKNCNKCENKFNLLVKQGNN